MDSYEMDTAWQQVVNRIKTYDGIAIEQVDAFFSRIHPMAMSKGFLMLTADNDFIKVWIEQHYLTLIYRALEEEYSSPFTVLIEVDLKESDEDSEKDTLMLGSLPESKISTEQEKTQSEPAKSKEGITQPVDSLSHLDDSYTFENFVIGDSNHMAYSMAVAVAETPGKAHLNPLFIYGKSGLGKTHLLLAIQNYITEAHPFMKVVYVDSERFVNDFMEASYAHDVNKASYKNFRTSYEDADVLLIDDVQSFQGKKQTLDIVFQIFNQLTSRGKQVVLSADRAPKNIDIDERYKSRFNQGITIDIQPPEIETKLGIIKSFIEEYQENEPGFYFVIPDDVQMYIAEISSSNIRELKSAVTNVIYKMTFSNQDSISVEEVKDLLENHFSGGSTRRLTVNDIQTAVEEFYHIPHADLIGKKRTRDIIYARQVGIYLCRSLLEIPFNEIGKRFNRDHSTVMYSVTNIETKMRENRELQEEIEAIKKIIKNL